MATAETERVLAVAGEGLEFEGLLRRASAVTPLDDWDIAFACEATVASRSWILVANGAGPTLAAKATTIAVERSRPDAIISTGLCGACDPALPAGSILVATQVVDQHGRCYPAQLPVLPAPAHCGALVSQDRVAVTAEEKAELFAAGPRAVEMEAAAVAEVAQRAGIPFYCIRVVSDDAQSSLPLDFNRYRKADGRFSRRRIALAAMLRPGTIPELIRFDTACRRSAILLGDTLADCRL
ncbi:MAG: hypothetical protein HY821_19595 [Acidobacteria bacterium]|nr:hypothetical protein [Acidobacteriota bacterium]